MPLFMKPASWEDRFESKLDTLERLYSEARSRNSNGQDVIRDVNKAAANDVRFIPHIQQGRNIGEDIQKRVQGDFTASRPCGLSL